MALPLLTQCPMIRFALMAALVLSACDGTEPTVGPDGGSDAAPEQGQGSLPRAALVVNEVSAKSGSGLADWIEIYNRSDVAIDLCDYFLTDSLDRLDHYYHLGSAPPPAVCAAKMLDSGAYYVVYADDDTAAGEDHAPFRLGLADEAHIVSTAGEAVDSLIFLHPSGATGLSLAREPNGEGLFWLTDPTLGAENSMGPGQ
jgi:hypothetical protein